VESLKKEGIESDNKVDLAVVASSWHAAARADDGIAVYIVSQSGCRIVGDGVAVAAANAAVHHHRRPRLWAKNENVLSYNELFGIHKAPGENWDGVWLGFEDVGPLSLIRFAGFVEVGVRCGYLDLNCFSARPELHDAIHRWTFSKEDSDPCESLAIALLNRLLEVQQLSEPRNAERISAFESYIRLDETVRGDPDLREFLEVCHRDGPEARDLFLTAPEFFAEALLTRRFGRLSVGGQV
jgi:hypothetical protein